MNNLDNLIEEIYEKIIEHNSELKKGNYNELKIEISKILKNVSNLNIPGLKITESELYGINIEFVGAMSNFLFPMIIYSNNFRIQILKDLNYFIKRDYTIEELGVFLSGKIQSTIGTKKRRI